MPASENVAVVVFDTLRKDSFDKHFEWLRSSGMSFENAWSTSHWTTPAHASLFTGQYASKVGTHAKNRYLNPTESNLATLLSGNGYRARGYTANKTCGPLFDFDQGFSEYLEILDRAGYHDFLSERSGVAGQLDFLLNSLQQPERAALIGDALRAKMQSTTWVDGYLDEGAKRLLKNVRGLDVGSGEFLFLNFMEAHAPYSPPSKYLRGKEATLNSLQASIEGPSDDPDVIRAAYNDSVRYLSDQYRLVHETLSQDYDYIITLSDHGEAFGEYDAWGHSALLPPSITKIPLTITGPAIAGSMSTTTAPVNLFDVYQTVCDIADVTPPSETHGDSLLDDLSPDRVCYVETHGCTENELKMLSEMGVSERVQEQFSRRRHAIATETGYAFETRDGSLAETGEVDAAAERLNEFADSRPDIDAPERDGEIDENVQARLERLGYA